MEYQKRIPFLLLLEIFLVGVVTGQKNIINLNDGAYSNLLIAIDKNVPEDLKIIENIKAMFTSASQRLYLATKQQVYWGHIKILVPNTWSIQSRYQKARNESSQSANILVHNFRDDEPFVDNFAGCGEEGTLIHITPAYILGTHYREDKFGNTDSVLVRTWGYYRWGLFKEHYEGIGGGAPAYDSHDGGTEGTRCSLKIKGNLTMPDGTTFECYSNQTGYNPDCRFVPDTEGQTATASLLFATRDAHIHSIKEFCVDGESDKDIQHNPLAPNLMNRLCGGDSAWKVMRERPTDFQADVPPVFSTAPVFEILQLSPVRSVVLVLDISESMRGNKFNRMVAASADYIMSVIPTDSKLGIVVYETESQIRANLTDITDTASRKRLVNALPSAPGHRSRVDFGILSGIEVLGSYSQGGYILLVSDGGEYHDKIPYDNITKSGVIIDTITISNSNYQAMEDLSKSTSGISSICSDIGIGTCLIQAFHSISERHEVGMKTVPIQIYSSEIIIEPNGFKTIPVVIDAALGKETVITVIWTKNQSISVVVTGQDRTQVDSRYYNDTMNRIVSINLPLAQAGLWNVTIIGQRQFDLMDTASVSVTSKPTTQENSPVTVTVLLGSCEVNFTETPALAIYAQVQRDYLPVLGADVTAIISFSDTSTTSMTLLDNGSGSDLLKDDGTYSGFFISFTSDGTYNVKVNVIGHDLAEDRTGNWFAESEVEPSFMRTAWGGVFKVQNYTRNPDDDILRPSRIHDLEYTSFSYDKSTVTLSWTAVGDDLDKGRASKYELRYSTNYYEVRSNFNTSHEVTQDQLVSGNLSLISPAGVIETVTISLPERGKEIVYYFAIRAWDEAGNGGDLSNIASLSIRYIPASVPTTAEPIPVSVPSTTEPIPASVPTTIEPIPVSVATIKPTGPDILALIIGLCCAVGVAIIVKAFVNNRNEQNIRKEFYLHPSLASKG
eukprot:XP_011668321.1 PREDICTED: calcium-activated chloride channel regulator 4A-like [Strongylocentrotus purpuratus]